MAGKNSKGKNKIILAGGGTGGHLYPGMAIAQEFQRQGQGDRILFAVTRRRMDRQIMSAEGWEYVTLPVESFRGISWRTARALVHLVRSIGQAVRLVRSFRPDLIIGLGAYPSVPMMVAGKLCRIPVVIQEQNLFPGGANRMLARWADRVFISFAETEKFLPSVDRRKIILTGNPVRRESSSNKEALLGLEQAYLEQASLVKGKFTLLIFGGSKGAHRINEVVMEGLVNLPKELAGRLQIIHQTGEEDFERVQRFYRQQTSIKSPASGKGAVSAVVLPFIHRMIEAYRLADLVICRAGATTVAEITLMGKAAVMIPYPYAVGDHQTTNARVLERAGAAELIPERELTGENLWNMIQTLMEHPQQLIRMQEESSKLGKPEATGMIVKECLNLIKSEKK